MGTLQVLVIGSVALLAVWVQANEDKRSLALGRMQFRPGKRDAEQEPEVHAMKKSLALGRMAFRPGKRSLALGRMQFRPGKRDALEGFDDNDVSVDKKSLAVGRADFRPGKRSLALGRMQFRPGKRSLALGRMQFRPGKRSLAMGRYDFRPGKRMAPILDQCDPEVMFERQQLIEDLWQAWLEQTGVLSGCGEQNNVSVER